MTQYLENMKIGDTILFRGPTGRLFYNEPGTRCCPVGSHSQEIPPVVLLCSSSALEHMGLYFQSSDTHSHECTYSDFCHCSNLFHTCVHWNVLIAVSAQMYEQCLLLSIMEGVHTNCSPRFSTHSTLPWRRLSEASSCLRRGPAIPWDAQP